MADVKVKGTFTVKAAGEAWTGTMKLGEWDQMVTMVYVPTIYFYRAPGGEWAGSKVVETLKDSLAQALFHFYPFAGRLHRGPSGSVELHCENQGAEVIEAESSSELADFGDFSCFPKFHRLIPCLDAMRTPLHQLPLVSVQLTRFRCGSLSIGLVTNHGIADGMAAYHFITEWTRLARGENLLTPPVHDRTLLRAGEPPRGPGFTDVDPPPAPEGPPPMMMPPMKETSMTMLPLSKAQMDKLKSLASASAGDQPTEARPFSRYEVLTAHIWRCSCQVKGSSDEEEAKVLGITLDARSRVSPALPRNYFGNAVLMVGAGSKAGELVKRPLGFACGRIRETIGRVRDEYVQADIDDLKMVGPMGPWRGIRNPIDLSLGTPDLGVISWLTLPLEAIDFGWGNYVHMSPGPSVMEGVTNILPGKEPAGALVVICLRVENVDKFKSYFYQHLL
ncbi:hypothetical protein V2J09_019917 [Rumex salicifolius]